MTSTINNEVYKRKISQSQQKRINIFLQNLFIKWDSKKFKNEMIKCFYELINRSIIKKF
jgi:hypothetical protein